MKVDVDEDRSLDNLFLQVVAGWDNSRPRSLQTTLGPSELGGCREYIRASVAGDPRTPETGFKSAAFMGTAVGDMIERILGLELDAILQTEITTNLPRTGITVAGSADAIIPAGKHELLPGGAVVDVKSKDGLAEIERYGVSMENLVQVSTYLVGAVQMGILGRDAVAVLLYVDRSGGTRRFRTSTVDYDAALRWVDLAEERLMDVQEVIDKGSPDEDRWAIRDKQPSWCFGVECAYRFACWEGSDHLPTEQITDPDQLEAIRRYVDGRDMEKDAASIKAAANKEMALLGVSGQTPDGTIVSWTRTGRTDPDGEPIMRLDVRVPKG